MPWLEQELLTLPEHLSSPQIFSGIHVTRSLVLCVCFVDRCLSFCTFFLWRLCCLFFDIRILITSLWYLQTLLMVLSMLWIFGKVLSSQFWLAQLHWHEYQKLIFTKRSIMWWKKRQTYWAVCWIYFKHILLSYKTRQMDKTQVANLWSLLRYIYKH